MIKIYNILAFIFFIIFFNVIFTNESSAGLLDKLKELESKSSQNKYMCLNRKSGGNYWLGPSGLGTTDYCTIKIFKTEYPKSYKKLYSHYNSIGGGSVRNIHYTKVLSLTQEDNIFAQNSSLEIKKEFTEKYVCSIWQASSFKIVDKINDKSRCTDFYYKKDNPQEYEKFISHVNAVISNKKYTDIKKSFSSNIAKSFFCIIDPTNNADSLNGSYVVSRQKDTTACRGKIIDENDKIFFDYLLVNTNEKGASIISKKKIIQFMNASKVRPLDEVLKEKYGDPKSEETKVTAKPKKKFQPKETISDDESPIIDIASVITVNDQAYTLKGKIKDKSAVYLTADGRAVDLNKDEFEIERFSVNPDQQQKIKIVAIDEWNNKSEKTVTVKIDLSQNKVAKKYEDLKPNNIRRVKTDNNKIAIIIGIEKYQYLNNLDAKYANRDANAFRAYATRALGIPSSNVEMLVDDKATRTQILKTFKNNLRRLAGKKGKDIHIFFAGHGLASDNGEDLYILPQDGESSLLEDTAISRVELIELIQQVNPNSVTMYFDTCYSGQTRDEQLLVASLRPVRIVADEQETPDNFTIFTASDYDQTSGSIEEAKHGMFSYYLMKGLEGNADLNTDNKITNGELISYLKDNVSQEAFIQNRQQDPMFSGDPDKVLVSF